MARMIGEAFSKARRKQASGVIATICLPSRLISWFEPSLPLFCMNLLCAGRYEAVLGQPGGEQTSKEAVFHGAKKRAATPCLDFTYAFLHGKSYPQVGFSLVFLRARL